ncbi:MAG: ETC complex I subunit [Alphaproteobacteria bacterium]|nr:ETC complex I subunit [Alphaproteobacteria bacterium]
MRARIYRPSKTSMQSGRAKTRKWVLEYEPAASKKPDSLMGWTTSTDTREQVRLKFETCNAAIQFATRNGLTYTVQDPQKEHFISKIYAANFDRKIRVPWTH